MVAQEPDETPGASQGLPHSVPSGDSFFLDLDEIQRTIDERFTEDDRDAESGIEARETLLVSFKGTLTSQHQAALRRYFETRMQKSKMRRIVIDLSAVSYIDSSTVGVLVWVRKTLAQDDGQLKVIVGEKIYDVLAALQMLDYLGVRQSKGESTP